jgi:hypothetical protein
MDAPDRAADLLIGGEADLSVLVALKPIVLARRPRLRGWLRAR